MPVIVQDVEFRKFLVAFRARVPVGQVFRVPLVAVVVVLGLFK